MRVLSFTSLFPNAARPVLGIFVYQRLAHLAKRNANLVQVVAPIPYSPSWLTGSRWGRTAQVPVEEKVGNLSTYHPRYVLLPRVSMPLHGWLMYAGTRRLVARLHKRMHFDCIDAHYIYPDGYAAILLGKELNLPVFVSARGTDINQFPLFATIRPLIKRTLREATGIIAVSQALKDAMVGLGAPAEKVQVIGNGVDLDRFAMLDRADARKKLGLPAERRALISVAALVTHKGQSGLISAFGQIADQYPELDLYLVGEGPMRPDLEKLIHASGLDGRVLLVGSKPNEELKFWYNAAELSCLVSSREGWPNVLLESMACGTPVLATSVGGVSEIVTSSNFGVVVEQGLSSIKRGMELALKKQWDRKALAEYAQSRTWDTVAAEVADYFTSRL